MKKMNCPKCGYAIITTMDKDGILINTCVNSECKYSFYDKADIDFKQQSELREKNKESLIKMRNDNKKLILVSHFRNLREQLKLSQKDIATALEFSEQRTGSIERNINTPTIIIAANAARALGVTLNDLYEQVLISKELYNKIKYLDNNLEINQVLAENDKKYSKLKNDIKDMKEEITTMNKEIKLCSEKIKNYTSKLSSKSSDNISSIEMEIEKLETTKKELGKLVVDKLRGIDLIQKEADKHYEIITKERNTLILKQYSVIEADNWERIKRKFDI